MYVVAKLKEQHRAKSRLRQKVAGDAIGTENSGSTVWDQSGWLIGATPCPKVDAQDPLVRHADWLGPVKLIGHGGNIRQLSEVFVSRELFGDRTFDSESNDAWESLLEDLNASVFANRSPAEKFDWLAPDTEQLAEWLTASGFQPAVDAEKNLRLTLKARGCDGQVHVCRNDRQLRMTMRLGTWNRLDALNETAMVHLARQANDRGRLARIAWIVDGIARRCEAQIDLTGLPTDGPAQRIWPDMLCMSMLGLTLALRRLGMELEVLADPSNCDIAAQLIESKLESVGVVPTTDT
jgi:hypothetical protein